MPKNSLRRAARTPAFILVALVAVFGVVAAFLPSAGAQEPPPPTKIEDVAGPESGSQDPPISHLELAPETAGAIGESGSVNAGAAETQGAKNIYQLVDSNDPGGPVPESANSCTGSYSPVFASGYRDDDEATVNLPWTMSFFGNNYGSLRVGVNGGIGFLSSEEVNFTNGNLGTSIRADHPAIYPFWDDLEFELANTTTSNAFSCVSGPTGARSLDIIWSGVDCVECADQENVTFKVKLFEGSSTIEFHYDDVVFAPGHAHNGAGSATIGIDSGDRLEGNTAYLQYSQNAFSVTAAHAIRFYVPKCDNRYPTQVATRGGSSLDGSGAADVLIGHLGPDTLRGFGGVDRICGLGSRDVLRAGSGDDKVWGGAGDDLIYGGGGSDMIIGGKGDDVIYGQGGTDDISGAEGNDEIMGGGAADILRGGLGNDVLRGSAGGDQMFGGADVDYLAGNIGPDTIFGGSGDDDLLGGEGNDALTGDSGSDKCAGNTGSADRAQASSCEQTPAVEILF